MITEPPSNSASQQGGWSSRGIVAVVVTWRTPAMTAYLLRYLEAEFPGLKTVLVDCGDTAEDIESTAQNVTVIRTPNLGYAGGNNLGLRAALETDPQWVLVLNSDAYPLGGCLDELIRALETHPEAAAAGCTLLSPHTALGIEVNNGTSFDWRKGRTAPAPALQETRAVDFCCGAVMLMRAAAVRRIGGFDSQLFLYYEELDWAERARALGYTLLAVPSARAIHLGSQTVAIVPKATTYYGARNRLICLRRYAVLHGRAISARRELAHLARAAAGHFLHRRWSRLVPLVHGTVAGAIGPRHWSDEPLVALAHQHWEARDQLRIRKSPNR